MPITVKVQPDLSAFRSATPAEISALLAEATSGFRAGDEPYWSPDLVAQQLLEHFTILPK